jgi:glycosyltransferase involved in cell wall biosynthesis
MIHFDTTHASSWRHASGLARVSERLLRELGPSAKPVRWPSLGELGAGDWLLTPELFSESERPGFTGALRGRRFRAAALYHDAIPLKLPDVTWPRSVERQPGYMKLLSLFDRVWAVSEASREELARFWKWQGVHQAPQVDVIELGADWPGVPRAGAGAPPSRRIVSVGILEPRKNQTVLLDAYERLRADGIDFELHLVGRVNPHFGRPIKRRVAALAASAPGVFHHEGMDDAALAGLIRGSRATAFPSVAEGCGLPVLESLWLGIPCVCGDIAPVAANAAAGGCLVVDGGGGARWAEALRRVLTDDGLHDRLSAECRSRALPTWSGAAATIRAALG